MCFSTFELPKAKYVAAFLQAINLFINVVAAFWYRKDILKDPQNLTIIAVVVMSMFMACFLLGVAKILFFFEDKRSQTCENYLNSQQKCRRDLIFGYGYIALFGYIPLVIGFVLGNSLKSLTGSFICNITCAIAYHLFVLQHLKTYQLCSPPLIPFIRYFQVLWLPCNFFLITAVLVIISANSTLEQCLSNIGFIIHYFIFFTIPMREFITVTMNGVWLPGQELVEMITMDNIPAILNQGDEDRMRWMYDVA
ncbi:hypothetical protein CAEBREN_00468 [Caenorhabditis brenneri]|uniref:Uncharacterized protein n=1 Tax=Caenorhabditis brenneri TaxID=135651 RepID=G0N7Y9_CAEBE|nr:hypothetical protein CAEBREN_00468 [Caenorhabditis brenneri]